MKKSPFALPLTVVVLSASSLLTLGQQPPQPGQPRPGRPPADPFAENQQEPETLSANYRITFSGKSGEEAIGELSVLTCSKKITLSGPLSSSDTPTTFTITGTLEEKDGLLILNYDPFRDLWHSLVNRDYKSAEGYSGLNPDERTYFSVGLLDGEVYNGGMHQGESGRCSCDKPVVGH